MKKIIIAALISIAFCSCEKNNFEPDHLSASKDIIKPDQPASAPGVTFSNPTLKK